MRKYGKFRLFLIVAAIFIGAAIFLNDPFTNNNQNTQNSAYAAQNAMNPATGNTVVINDEDVALGIPGTTKTAKINWTVIGVSIAVVNLAGALIVIFISGEEKA